MGGNAALCAWSRLALGIPVPVENLVNNLCQLISKTDALAYAADDLFDDVMWIKDGAQTRRIVNLRSTRWS